MDWLSLIIGFIIGLLFARSPWAKRIGLDSSAIEVKQLTAEVLEENTSKTQTIMNDSVRQINEQVRMLQDKVYSLEKTNAESMTSLSENVRSVADIGRDLSIKTHTLDSALRTQSTAGRWGEIQLKRLVELSGMTKHVDFFEQETNDDQRPDMVIRFANNSTLPVDSKVSLIAYLDGVGATDKDTRRAKSEDVYKAIKNHIDALVKRKYHESESSLPFTVMYVQVEGSLSFADEARGTKESLVEYAISKNIIIATPGTLMALLRTAHLSWRQRQEVANALDLLEVVKELGKRMDTFIGYLSKHAKAIHDVNESYSTMVASWNSRAVPQFNRLNSLRSETIEKVSELPIHALEQQKITRISDADDNA